MNTINRRAFFQTSGLAGLSFLGAGLSPIRAVADPDPPTNASGPAPAPTNPAGPEIYSFQLGNAEAFVIHDGAVSFNSIQPIFVPEAKPSEIEAILNQNFLPANHLSVSMNVLVIKSQSGVILFDAGAGHAFGPIGGRLMNGLSKIGIAPGDVKTIFVTHAHADHIGGLVDDSNQLVFGLARIIAAKPEVAFWTGDSPDLSGVRISPETKTQSLATIKKFLAGMKPSLELKDPGHVSPEVELIAAPGHTPGHSLFAVTQGEEKLLVIGDSVHLHALQFARPEWTMAYDVNPPLAITTRRKIFKDAAAQRTTLMAYHLPFPGIGHIRASGPGYEWVPRPWVV
jgi:glyoxylase-like metal-dependent hydrolase (beta-lactamase superfamily II)